MKKITLIIFCVVTIILGVKFLCGLKIEVSFEGNIDKIIERDRSYTFLVYCDDEETKYQVPIKRDTELTYNGKIVGIDYFKKGQKVCVTYTGVTLGRSVKTVGDVTKIEILEY